MLDKIWGMILDWLKEQPFWPKVQTTLIAVCVWLGAEILAYQYIQWRYQVSPPPWMFLSSYISRRITLLLAVAAALLVALRPRGEGAGSRFGKLLAAFRANRRAVLGRALFVTIALAVVAVGFRLTSPREVSQIRIKFMEPTRDFRPEVFAYLVYELNRVQKDWYFEIDFEPFNPAQLTSRQREQCEQDRDTVLCFTEVYAEGRPTIGISREALGDAYFARHRGPISVITTHEKESFKGINIYKYLAFMVVVQSIVIHLDVNGGLPQGAFQPGDISRGGLFQFTPREDAIKSVILASRFSPQEEMLIFNRFGPDYWRACTEVLSMDWYHASRVQDNMRKVFGVQDH